MTSKFVGRAEFKFPTAHTKFRDFHELSDYAHGMLDVVNPYGVVYAVQGIQFCGLSLLVTVQVLITRED